MALAAFAGTAWAEPLEGYGNVKFGKVMPESEPCTVNKDGYLVYEFNPPEADSLGMYDWTLLATPATRRVFEIRGVSATLVLFPDDADGVDAKFARAARALEEKFGRKMESSRDGAALSLRFDDGLILLARANKSIIRFGALSVQLREEAKREAAKEDGGAAATTPNLFAKAKKAEEDGLINFYGFYLGMPKEDAIALREYYGLDEEECKIEVVEHGNEMSSLNLSLPGLRRLTKGGNSFEELAQAVANRVGDLKWNAYWEHYSYSTIDGIIVSISNGGFRMHGGKQVEKLAAQRKEKWLQEAATILGTGKEAGETKTIALPGRVTMEMVWCPPGAFMMGSPKDDEERCDDEQPQHQVALTKGFWMAKTEVTQKQWKSVMGNNPSEHKGDEFPVESVSWNDCQEFCKKMGLTLPTEAEWEYACRAGTTGPYGGSGKLDEMGWYAGNSENQTHSVGRKQANAWGLYDMHGNVWEWCEDWSGAYPNGVATDPKGLASGKHRVLRGGDYSMKSRACRSAFRLGSDPGSCFWYIGFRPVLRQD